MGGGLDTSPDPDQQINYSQVFAKAFPYYLAIGMTYDLFYNQDATIVCAYREADKMLRHRKNEELWLQGYYFYNAICSASPLLNAFAEKGTHAKPYLTQPIAVTVEDQQARQAKEDEEKYKLIKAKLQAFAKR